MLRLVERASDRLASMFVEQVDVGACYPRDKCYCAPQACSVGQPCPGALYMTNCLGHCVYAGAC